MDENALRDLLESVRRGRVGIDQAVARLRRLPFEDVGFATVDHHRTIRCGFPEVVFCPGKTIQQICTIFERLAEVGGNVLATRAGPDVHEAVARQYPAARYNDLARAITLRQGRRSRSVGHVAIVAAGTSDLGVAEEARVTAEIMGQHVTTHYDVGVAGLHRLLAHSEALQSANVVVVVAGMEGALASVVGGLVAVPVVAVPTSVGYGASFGGLAALLTMLNSCASGVSVVNIDNGFAGGYIAAMINRQSARNARRDRVAGVGELAKGKYTVVEADRIGEFRCCVCGRVGKHATVLKNEKGEEMLVGKTCLKLSNIKLPVKIVTPTAPKPLIRIDGPARTAAEAIAKPHPRATGKD